MSFQKILVAIDDSKLCNSVFVQALELAQANRASLMLFNCLSNEAVAEALVPMSVEMGLYSEMANTVYEAQHLAIENQLEEGRSLLQKYCETATAAGITTEFNCQIGEPGHLLCEAAQSQGADLIVLGRRGRKGLTEALLGSVSNYVLHHAPCSVLVIQTTVESEGG